MINIQMRYINSAVRIRNEYLTCMHQILLKEEKVNNEKKLVDIIMSELRDTYDTMNVNKNFDEKILNERLMEIEVHLKKIQSEFKPINEKMEKLKLDAKNLNKLLKEKYPNLSDAEIKTQLDPYLIKCDESFKKNN